MYSDSSSSYLRTETFYKLKSELRWVLALFLILNTVSILSILYFQFSNFENPLYYLNWILNFYAGIAVFTGVSIFLRKILKGIEGRAYTSLTIGLVFFFLGETTWTYYQVQFDLEIPYPSLADLFWLLGYCFFFYHIYGTYSFWKHNRKIDRRKKVITSVIVVIIGSFLIYLTLIDSFLTESNLLTSTISLIYIILDIILVIPAILIVWSLRTKNPFFTHWLLISFFIIFQICGDLGFGYTYTINEEYAANLEWIWDIFFNLAYISIAVALIWYQKLVKLTYKDIIDITEKEKKLLFDMWKSVKPSDNNINIDDSKPSNSHSSFKINLKNQDEISQYLEKIVQNTQKQIIIWYNNKVDNSLKGNSFLSSINQLKKDGNISIRILLPSSYKNNFNINLLSNTIYLYSTQVDKFDNIFIISDNNLILVAELTSGNNKEISSIYSNNKMMILSYMSIFENNWNLALLNEQKI